MGGDDDTRGLWSVDHIIPSSYHLVSAARKRYPADGSIVRLVNYKKDPDSSLGIRYLLIPKNQPPSIIDFGNTYFISKNMTETVDIELNGIQYRIRQLREPIETIEDINKTLFSAIQSLLGEAQASGSPDFSDDDARPIGQRGDRWIWARIHVHYVGQGDTIVLELPNNQLWMIDARFWTRKRRNAFDQWMDQNFKGRRLNRLIISHFHYDHIHSVPDVIKKYNPDQVVVSDSLIHRTAKTRKTLMDAGQRLRILKTAEITKFGELEVHLQRTDQIFNVNQSRDPNDHEISVCLKTRNSFAFLAGDIPGSICNQLFSTNSSGLNSNHRLRFYKVSHHGSETGYDGNFLQQLSPDVSIISCGQNNRFGHPNRPPLGHLGRQTIITWQMNQNVYTCAI
jgi:competence protein ComEC